MSGAQPKATVIAGMVCIVAEVNPKAVEVRHSQGWVDEVYTDLNELMARAIKARENKEAVSLAYQGNIVDLWRKTSGGKYSGRIGLGPNIVAQSVCRWLLPGRINFRGIK